METRFRGIWTACRVAVIAVLLSLAPALGQDGQLASANTRQSWEEALSLVDKGDFLMAKDRLAPLLGAVPEAIKIDGWLASFLQMQSERHAMTQADFSKYVEYSRHAAGADKLSTALYYACLALDNSGDPNAFRNESWLQEIVNKALTKAQEHRSRAEWRDSVSLYDQLSYLFDRNVEYKKLRRECLTHFRLEFIYRPDNNWQEQLQGIDPSMVTDSFYYIDQEYVEKADFKAMTVSALEQLLMLVRTPNVPAVVTEAAELKPGESVKSGGIREVFPSLNDDVYREQFERRIEKRLAQVQAQPTVTRKEASEQHFPQVLKINKETLQLPEALIVSEYMQGALEALDEFTSIFWPADYREFMKHTDGEFIGVGIQISKRNEEIVVATPLADTPAYKAGIVPGDVIAQIDGQPTKGLSLTKAVQLITGPKNTSVTLTIRRTVAGEDKEIEYKLTRSEIKLQTVKGMSRDPNDEQSWNFMLDPELGIGYIRVDSFSKRTVDDLQSIVTRLQGEGLRALILDLRNDPGGLLQSAQAMAELFLPKGNLIVRTEGLRSEPLRLEAESNREFESLPLTLLINEGSASASEIVAGALKDHGRAILVGDRSYGKFSVQNLQPLSGREAALKYTTAWYYLPGGANLHRKDDSETWGVDPHIPIKLVPKEIEKFREMMLNKDRLGPAAAEVVQAPPMDADTTTGDAAERPDTPGQSEGDVKVEEEVKDDFVYEDTNNRPESDPQLEAALLITRIRLLSGRQPLMATTVEPVAQGVDDRAATNN